MFFCGFGDWFVGNNVVNSDEKGFELVGISVNNLVVGIIVCFLLEVEDCCYLRCVVFVWNINNELILDSSLLILIGINNNELVNVFFYSGGSLFRLVENVFWFRIFFSNFFVLYSNNLNDYNYGN